MDYNEKYIDLLRRAPAGEIKTARQYPAIAAAKGAMPRLFKTDANKADHQSITAGLLAEAVFCQSALWQALIAGVKR